MVSKRIDCSSLCYCTDRVTRYFSLISKLEFYIPALCRTCFALSSTSSLSISGGAAIVVSIRSRPLDVQQISYTQVHFRRHEIVFHRRISLHDVPSFTTDIKIFDVVICWWGKNTGNNCSCFVKLARLFFKISDRELTFEIVGPRNQVEYVASILKCPTKLRCVNGQFHEGVMVCKQIEEAIVIKSTKWFLFNFNLYGATANVSILSICDSILITIADAG